MSEQQQKSTCPVKKARCSTKFLMAILAVTLIVFFAELTILYLKFIPSVLESVKHYLPVTMTNMLEESFVKVIVGLGVWAVLFFIMNIALIVVCRNLRKSMSTANAIDREV